MQSLPRRRVLYVDDDEDTCEMVRLLFSSHGVEVWSVDSAADASLKIKTAQFDVLMLDVWLPGLDGLEFCRQVRRTGSSIPILFYSGAAYESDIAKGLAAGADAYLVKPDIDGLVQAVLTVLEPPVVNEPRRKRSQGRKVPASGFWSDDYFGVRTASD